MSITLWTITPHPWAVTPLRDGNWIQSSSIRQYAADFWGRLRVCVLFNFEVDLHLAWTRVTVHHFDGRVRPPRDRSPENNHSRGFFPSRKTSAGSIFSLFNGWPLVLLQALLEIGAVTCLLFPIKKNGPPAVPTCSIRELELKCI